MTDDAILKEIGRRSKALRLHLNISADELGDEAQINRNTLSNLENGKNPTLKTFIKVLRELDALDGLDALLPEPEFSPIEIAKLKGHRRKKASPKRS